MKQIFYHVIVCYFLIISEVCLSIIGFLCISIYDTNFILCISIPFSEKGSVGFARPLRGSIAQEWLRTPLLNHTYKFLSCRCTQKGLDQFCPVKEFHLTLPHKRCYRFTLPVGQDRYTRMSPPLLFVDFIQHLSCNLCIMKPDSNHLSSQLDPIFHPLQLDKACCYEILISITSTKTQQATHCTDYVPVSVQVISLSSEISGACAFRSDNPTRSRVPAA